MGRETWGTYSVRDHLQPQAFVADAMLYDRLVVPVPPENPEHEHATEWARWQREGWQPERQAELLDILGPLAYPVEWGSAMRGEWEKRWVASKVEGESTTPYHVTGGVLAADLPPNVTAVTAVATYTSKQAFDEGLMLTPADANVVHTYPGSVVCAALGREFLVPDADDHRFRSHSDLLRASVDLAGDVDFRQKRRSFWRWEREFISDGVADQASIDDAVEEMRELIEDEKRAVRRQKVRTVSRYAFCIATVTLGIVGGPLTPVAIAGAFASVGQFTTERLLEGGAPASPSPAALFHDSRKQLGWH